MATPTNPFSELTQVFERMQENFETMARSWETDPFEMTAPISRSVDVDLQDMDEELVLTATLPGFDSDDIDLRVTNQMLHLEAEQTETTEETEGEFIRQERRHESVSRSIPLPTTVEAEEISATYNNGILTIHLPKVESASEGRHIEVE